MSNGRYVYCRHGLKVAQSSISEAGYGLFAARDIPAGAVIPVKGPWFLDAASLKKYLQSLEPTVAAKLKDRLVLVHLSTSSEA